MTRVRRSAHVVVTWRDGEEIVAYSPLTGERTPLSPDTLRRLLDVPVDRFSEQEGDWIDELCRRGVLLAEDGSLRDAEHRRRDEAISAIGWDPDAAYFHFAKRWQGARAKLATKPPDEPDPPAFSSFSSAKDTVDLPLVEASGDLYDLLRRRRTERAFDDRSPIPLETFSTLLRYVWGAHGHGRDSRGEPVITKTSPSGGSLHPIEAYPLVRDVEGVSPGLYHYSVSRHGLEQVEELAQDEVADLIELYTAGQHWFRAAQAAFIMTARFERIFAKYRKDANAYRALLLDAGHLSQTFYLVCTDLGLGPFFTTACNHVDIDTRLELDVYREGAICICGCAVPTRASGEVAAGDSPYVPRVTGS